MHGDHELRKDSVIRPGLSFGEVLQDALEGSGVELDGAWETGSVKWFIKRLEVCCPSRNPRRRPRERRRRHDR